MTELEKIIARRDEFDKELRQLEDELSVLQERINVTREKVKNIKTIEDAEEFDNWYEKNFLDDGLQYTIVELP